MAMTPIDDENGSRDISVRISTLDWDRMSVLAAERKTSLSAIVRGIIEGERRSYERRKSGRYTEGERADLTKAALRSPGEPIHPAALRVMLVPWIDGELSVDAPTGWYLVLLTTDEAFSVHHKQGYLDYALGQISAWSKVEGVSCGENR